MIAGFNNSYLNKLLKSIQYSLRQGFSLYTSFKNTHLNNSIFMELINVGEQTGMLKETLHYNNVFLSKDVDNFIDEFTQIFRTNFNDCSWCCCRCVCHCYYFTVV